MNQNIKYQLLQVKYRIWSTNFINSSFTKLDLKFSQRWLWRVLSSGIYRSAVRWKWTDVSEERVPSIFRIKEYVMRETTMKHAVDIPENRACHLLYAWLILRPWRWRYHVPPKHRMIFNGVNDVLWQRRTFLSVLISGIQVSNINPIILYRTSCTHPLIHAVSTALFLICVLPLESFKFSQIVPSSGM
jgi:hypothetical protein